MLISSINCFAFKVYHQQYYHIVHKKSKSKLDILNPQISLQVAELASISTASIALESRMKAFGIDPTIFAFSLSVIFSIRRGPFPGLSRTSQEFVQKLAWSSFLQSSLVLNVFGSKKIDPQSMFKSFPAYECMIAFCFAALGSFVGGLISHASLKHIFGFPHDSQMLKYLGGISASLTSSYIGGTANLYEVANILKLSTLVNSVAAIDIAVMVCFFQVLHLIHAKNKVDNTKLVASTIVNEPLKQLNLQISVKDFLAAISRIIKLIFGALLVTQLASAIQKLLPFQGMSVMISIILATIFNSLKPNTGKIRTELDVLSQKASLFMLCMFYATIGLNSGISDIKSTGRPVLYLMTSTLTVRIFIIFYVLILYYLFIVFLF